MKRRGFIKVMGAGIGTVALSSAIVSCGETNVRDSYGWNGPEPDEKDIRMRVLTYAMLCPNPHNKQPWIIRFTGSNSFDLYVDPERLLPATDPYYRQIHIGQGTFLETLAIAATGLGHEAFIDYFPQGMYGNKELLDKPVASIKLIEQTTIAPDPLFAHLLNRHSNKREYDKIGLNLAERDVLQAFHGSKSRHPLTIVHSPEAKQHCERILTEAMQIEVGNPSRDEETIKMFRFNEDEVTKYRDGFGVEQAGLSGLKKFFVETLLLSRENVEKDPSSFGQQAVEITQNVAASTSTFAWMSTPSNQRVDQVKVGRDYCRFNLKATAMGIAQHPMSQVLQEYEEMLPLQASFKESFKIPKNDTVQMLFRLGKAEATPHGPRRLISSIIRA